MFLTGIGLNVAQLLLNRSKGQVVSKRIRRTGRYGGGAARRIQPQSVHFNGRKNSFTAHVYVTQIDLKAVIIGVIAEGWLKGNLVERDYTQINCSHDNIVTDCFQGTLDILQDGKH